MNIETVEAAYLDMAKRLEETFLEAIDFYPVDQVFALKKAVYSIYIHSCDKSGSKPHADIVSALDRSSDPKFSKGIKKGLEESLKIKPTSVSIECPECEGGGTSNSGLMICRRCVGSGFTRSVTWE